MTAAGAPERRADRRLRLVAGATALAAIAVALLCFLLMLARAGGHPYWFFVGIAIGPFAPSLLCAVATLAVLGRARPPSEGTDAALGLLALGSLSSLGAAAWVAWLFWAS